MLYEPWGLEKDEIFDWEGFTYTGATNSFQIGIGPKQKVEDTFNSFYGMTDYYMICPMRFNKWFRCDMTYGNDREKYFDRNPKKGRTNMKLADHYPCFREFY